MTGEDNENFRKTAALLWLSLSEQMEPQIKCLLPQINNVLLWKIDHHSFRASIWIEPNGDFKLSPTVNIFNLIPLLYCYRMESTEKCEVVIQHFNGKYLKTPPGIPGESLTSPCVFCVCVKKHTTGNENLFSFSYINFSFPVCWTVW